MMKKSLLALLLTCVLGLSIFTISQVFKSTEVNTYEVTSVNKKHSDKEILGKTDDGEYYSSFYGMLKHNQNIKLE